MDQTTQAGTQKPNLSTEFSTWPLDDKQQEGVTEIRTKFDSLLASIALRIPPGNERYMAIVRTKLEEACMFAVKGVSNPGDTQ